jgi:hypothetical protein
MVQRVVLAEVDAVMTGVLRVFASALHPPPSPPALQPLCPPFSWGGLLVGRLT